MSDTTDQKIELGLHNPWIRAFGDGTIGTTPKLVRRYEDARRVAIVQRFAGKLVEVELTQIGRKFTIVGRLVVGAISHNGTASSLIIMRPSGLVADAYSTALVDSITELTDAEYAERVNA